MTLDQDIAAFEYWANTMGFPQKDIPNRDALKSIFKSRQRDLFINMMERVRPRQEVQEIRENILIRKMSKYKDHFVTACSRSFLPKDMQNYFKVKDLMQKKKELEGRITEHLSQYNSVACYIRTKNMEATQFKQRKERLTAKVNMMEMKRDSLKNDIAKEKSNENRIKATMPVKLTPSNASESVAAAAVEEAFKELDSFYNIMLNNSNPHTIQEAKDEMWKKMRKLFANVPNFLIFNSILKSKEEQLQNIMALNKSPPTSMRENLSAFNIKLMKAKVALLGLAANYMSARHESHVLNQRFSTSYNHFVEALQCEVNLFNVDAGEDIDDIISNYVVQYNTRSFNRGQNDYIMSQIDLCKAQIESGNKLLENHEILLNSIKQVYSDIDSSINRIQYEVIQLNQMKEKILFAKNMGQHILGDMQLEQTSFMPSITKISASGDSNTIFDMSSANVFSSTKLDFDATLNSSVLRLTDMTMMPVATQSRYVLPPILTEITTFMETSFEKFSCVTKDCGYYLMANPLITESHELSSTIQLVPGKLLTPYGCLQEVMKRVAWFDSISDFSLELKTNTITVVGVNAGYLQTKAREQYEQLVELLDKIEVADINTKRLLRKAMKYYQFLLKNPLKNYIPSTKCLNSQNFSGYEAEYHTYYRMVTMGKFTS